MEALELKPEVLTNPKKLKKVVHALIKILETQQSQLQALADDHNRQEQHNEIVYKRWISGVRCLKDVIDQLRRQTKLSQMARLVEAAKINLVFGLKMKQELVYKLKLDNMEDELADFREWFDILCHRCPVDKDVCQEKLKDFIEESGRGNGSIKAGRTKKALEEEVRKLKCEYEKLSVKHSSEVSALQSKKEFVRNQLAVMENRYATRLKEKDLETSQVNARFTKLVEGVEQMNSSNMEKDEQIADMKASLAKMEAEALKKDGEVFRLLGELKSLKTSNSELLAPVLRPCSAEREAKTPSSNEGHERKRKRKTCCVTSSGTAETKAKADEKSSKSKRKRKTCSFTSSATAVC